MLRHRSAWLLALALVVAGCGSGSGSDQRPALVVAAASDLRSVFESARPTLEEASGATITFVFGSSGQLQRQVQAGAEYDIFFSADLAYVEALASDGAVIPDSVAVYAVGRLALAWRTGIPPLDGLGDLVRDDIGRVAIANPDHAPYGRAARQALEQSGLWDELQRKLVLGENVQQTTDYVESGNADAGLVAYPLVIGTEIPHVLVDAALHAPIRQGVAIVARGKSPVAARRLVDFILGPEGQQLLRAHGFEGPPDVR